MIASRRRRCTCDTWTRRNRRWRRRSTMPDEPRRPNSPRRGGFVHWLVRAFAWVLGLVGLARAAVPEGRPPEPHGEPAEGPRPAGPHHDDVRFERTDVRLRGVLIVIAAAACVASFHYSIVWWWFGRYNNYESAIKESPFPLAEQPSMKLPAEPRLEQLDRMTGRPTDAFPRLEAKEDVLNTTGPTDDPGFVHIPIKRAMAIVAGRLPADKAPPPGPPKNTGLLDEGEPNSGRVYRGERR